VRSRGEEPAGRLGLLERGDEVGGGGVVHPPAVLGRGDRQANGEMGLSHTRGPEEDHILPPLDEREGVEALELIALDRGLEAEIEVAQRLHCREPGRAHGGLEPALIAERGLPHRGPHL
jgi:hypothetical protein